MAHCWTRASGGREPRPVVSLWLSRGLWSPSGCFFPTLCEAVQLVPPVGFCAVLTSLGTTTNNNTIEPELIINKPALGLAVQQQRATGQGVWTRRPLCDCSLKLHTHTHTHTASKHQPYSTISIWNSFEHQTERQTYCMYYESISLQPTDAYPAYITNTYLNHINRYSHTRVCVCVCVCGRDCLCVCVMERTCV